jgi:opacity protein-like surface antigen
MKHLLSASLAVLALVSQAMAADLPLYTKAPPPVPSWSWAGFYAGINAGYSFGRDPFSQSVPETGYLSATNSVVNPRARWSGASLVIIGRQARSCSVSKATSSGLTSVTLPAA